jgi:chromosomal replication initiation ATPase DnaA
MTTLLLTPLVRSDIDRVIRVAAAVLDVDPRMLLGERRLPELVAARHLAVFIAKTRWPQISTTRLGQVFQRDHTTIMDALRRAQQRIESGELWAPYAEVLRRLEEDQAPPPKPAQAPEAPGGELVT